MCMGVHSDSFYLMCQWVQHETLSKECLWFLFFSHGQGRLNLNKPKKERQGQKQRNGLKQKRILNEGTSPTLRDVSLNWKMEREGSSFGISVKLPECQHMHSIHKGWKYVFKLNKDIGEV